MDVQLVIIDLLVPMFFNAKSVQQVAVLPFVIGGDGIEVLLITSRETRRWIIPKGWPVKGLTMAMAAAAEAAEEAGVVGSIDDTPIGDYHYGKRMPTGYTVRCHVFVYPMLVREHRLSWPEQHERQLRWCRLEKADSVTGEPELADLFAELAATGADQFDHMAETFEGLPTDNPQVGHISARAA